jgi:leucyl-tRNA synthetase
LNLEELKTRTALEIALFEVWNDFRWFVRRKGGATTKVPKGAFEVWLKMLAPFTPFICEELWSSTNGEGFISTATWPQVEEGKIDDLAEERENLLIELIEDTANVLKATKITPKQIVYYTAAPWKWKIYNDVLEKSTKGEIKINEIMKEISKDPELKNNMKAVAGFVQKAVKEISRIPAERKKKRAKIHGIDENEVIGGAVNFLNERFNAKIKVFKEDDLARYDPKQRASAAMPYQSAIYLE